MSNFVFGAVNDADESLKSKSGGSFGLNQGHITKIEFNPNAGKDGAAANAVDIVVQIADREYNRRIYETTGALYGANNALVQPGEDGYDELYATDMKQKTAVIIHAVKATGVTQQTIDATFATPATSFTDWAKKVIALVPPNYKSLSVDAFLEYQWEIKEGQDRTYVEVPKNMKGGYFLIASVKAVGSWKEQRDSDGLKYVDDAGNVHPFDRNLTYMESNKANQQGAGATKQDTPTGATASQSTW